MLRCKCGTRSSSFSKHCMLHMLHTLNKKEKKLISINVNRFALYSTKCINLTKSNKSWWTFYNIKSTHQQCYNKQMGKDFRQNVNRKSIEIKSNWYCTDLLTFMHLTLWLTIMPLNNLKRGQINTICVNTQLFTNKNDRKENLIVTFSRYIYEDNVTPHSIYNFNIFIEYINDAREGDNNPYD